MSAGPPRQAVILIGGLGTRLGDLTRDIPKPLLPVAGRPFLEHLLAKARRHGLDRVLLLAGYRPEAVDAYLQDSDVARRLGLAIEISVEPQPLGTGGALALARPALDESFLLLNGDTWFDFDWGRLLARGDYPAFMALRRIARPDRYETVDLQGDRVAAMRVRDVQAAEGLINGGVYRLSRDGLAGLDRPGAFSLEADVLPELARQGRLGGAAFDGPFIDIGVPESLEAAQTLITMA